MTFLLFLDYIGTAVFAISGVLTASEKRLDLFGAMFIGVVTAIGGGTTRDLLLGVQPVTWLQSSSYIWVILVSLIIAVLFRRYLAKIRRTLFLFDTIGISVFTVIGVEKALSLSLSPVVAVLMGMTTAVVGGVIRDTLNNEVPLIFRREIYATACIGGAVVYILMRWAGMDSSLNQIFTVFAIFSIRLLSIRYNWSMPILSMPKQDDDTIIE